MQTTIKIICVFLIGLLQSEFLLRTCLIVLSCILLSHAIEIACDDKCFGGGNPCCLLTDAAINSADVIISGLEDESVRLFDSSRNRKVEYLPIHIADKFPNLVTFAADRCAIKEITKNDFENLFHLQWLNLDGNKLEIIKADVFKDLISLEALKLSKIFLISYPRPQNNKINSREKQNQGDGR